MGGKSAGSARTPREAADSLHSIAYAKIIDLVSEGEVVGLVDGLRSVYLDGTPLQGQDGTLNFQDVRVQTRAGTQAQDPLVGFPSVENEVTVGVELTSDAPVVRTVSNSELTAVRVRIGVPALSKTDTSNGDINGYRIGYAIDIATDGGAYSTVLTDYIAGKTTTLYERSRRVELPPGSQWQVRVRRLTPNQNSGTIADRIYVQSLTEIIDAKLRYPNSALVAVEVDASQFQSIPTRAYYGRWRIIQAPSNYDPESRTYSGIWNGTFKSAWTNNPAWVFYDIVTNDRFGLGHRIPAAYVDRWKLYQIAQYCDQMVSDGLGGLEPRFVCNVYLQTRQDAFKLLQDLASVFRGISYYAVGQVIASADMPTDPVYAYTQANVIDGRFTYAGSARKTRHTVALVSWNDPTDFGRAKVEPVEYRAGIARYGIQQTEVTAFGCTSLAQAQRIGLHILLTENLETETVQFGVGLEGTVTQPGDIIQIADPNRAGRRNGGRISSVTNNRTVVLDKAPAELAVGDTIRVLTPGGRSEARTISSVQGRSVTVSAPWTAVPRAQSVWSVESADLALQTFRVLSVTEGEGITFNITALKHVPQKFDAIDNGTKIELPPISIIPPSVQPPPTNVTLTSFSMVEQGVARHTLTIAWEAADKAINYEVEWRRDDMDWVKAGKVATTSIDIPGIYAGQYLARVRAINALGAVSLPAMSALTQIEGKTTPPPALTSLVAEGIVFGINLAWGFPQGATDTQRTEIWYSPANDLEGATKLGDFAYPQRTHSMLGLAAGVTFFFWGRLVDRSGNIGPWYPLANGVVGQSSSDATEILDYLAGQIGRTELAEDLLASIDSIDNLIPLVWSEEATYEKGTTVVYGGRIWSWNNETPGNNEPPSADWDDVGEALAEAGALVGRVNILDLQVNDPETGLAAIGTQTQGLVARFSPWFAGDEDGGVGSLPGYAGTVTVDTVIADGDYAMAKRVETVQAAVGETSASVQQVSQTVVALDGRVSATYTVRAQISSAGQIYMAGLGVGVEQQQDGSYQSQILMQADRFGLINILNGVVTTPFVIQNGQTFINQALIGTGWIQNAMIGDIIQSTALGAGNQPRWRLDKNGTLTMRGVNVNGGFMELTDSALRFWNSGGNVALVELGELL
jgi:predicted phage tail protein